MNNLVMGALALVAIVIIALALSGTNHDVAIIVQAGLVIAIIAVLVRSGRVKSDGTYSNPFLDAWNSVVQNAIGVTGKQASS